MWRLAGILYAHLFTSYIEPVMQQSLRKLWAYCWVALLLPGTVYAQNAAQTSVPTEGLRVNRPTAHAFVNCTLVPSPGQKIENATILVENGVITYAGPKIDAPKYMQVHDLSGRWVYPGFVDAYGDVGAGGPRVQMGGGGGGRRGDGPQPKSGKEGPWSWNQSVQPERMFAEEVKPDNDKLEAYRNNGFTTVHAFPKDGVFRGTGVVLNLSDEAIQKQILLAEASINASFQKGPSRQDYPSSLFGCIALMRQTLIDRQWYQGVQKKLKENPRIPAPETNLSLEALQRQFEAALPVFFTAQTANDVLRINKIDKEFGLPGLVIKGAGYEYELADQIAAAKLNLIEGVDYPDAPDVEDPGDALAATLQQMKRWEQAPANLYWLASKNIRFAVTPTGGKGLEKFWANLRKAINHGLKEDDALRALTLTPAEYLKVDKLVGSVERGKLANFVIANGNLFTGNNKVYQTCVGGKLFDAKGSPAAEVRGTYSLSVGGKTYKLDITGESPKYDAAVSEGDKKLGGAMSENMGQYVISFAQDTVKKSPVFRLKGTLKGDSLRGSGMAPSGAFVTWAAKRTDAFKPKAGKPAEKVDPATLSPVSKPNIAYGWNEAIPSGAVLVQNATVWTNAKDGIVTDTDVLIENGKISAVGKGLKAPAGARVLDGRGKHLTNGVIDEHSHIGAEGSINEPGSAISSEVRIADVLRPEDPNIYRQLAGGVTAVHVLHGSANPIGGQTQFIKLRWGANAEEMKVDGWPGYIKFALGENVKQANWGDNFTSRYPQTRMGVEQFIRDQFMAAKDYKKAWDDYNGAMASKTADKSTLLPPRRDLRLDALVEILEGKRHITCHSYVQSEITMLIRLAEEQGFKINTFTHILEGYKVADKMAKAGIAGSTFSDWWAYKMEVVDAIPYNGAMMAKQGVLVCINSDDAEQARRLNQEAAKCVMYGGMSEEDAWKTVTLNPAKALRMDSRMGSIQAGKDADLVLWSDNPLSIYARAEYTLVDGRILYDRVRDEGNRNTIAAERTRLIQKLLAEKKGGAATVKPSASFDQSDYKHCNDKERYNHGTEKMMLEHRDELQHAGE
jgi:imidazolonepropionase-like amidohydrolase